MYLKKNSLIFLLLIFSFNSYAYIDPGSGSVIIQAIIGAIAACGVAVKMYWYKFKRFFKKNKNKNDKVKK